MDKLFLEELGALTRSDEVAWQVARQKIQPWNRLASRGAALDHVGYESWGISGQPANQAADVETARDLAQRMDLDFYTFQDSQQVQGEAIAFS